MARSAGSQVRPRAGAGGPELLWWLVPAGFALAAGAAGAAFAGGRLAAVVLPAVGLVRRARRARPAARSMPWVLARMPAGYRPMVADNGSADGSADVARQYGARVVDVPRRGFGGACHAGLLAATDPHLHN